MYGVKQNLKLMCVAKALEQFNIVWTIACGVTKPHIAAGSEKLFYHVKTTMEVVYSLPTGMSHRCRQKILRVYVFKLKVE